MYIRQAIPNDKPVILEIINLLYLDIPDFVWNTDSFVTKQISQNEYFVAEDNGTVVGIMSLRVRNEKIHIETLAVRKEFQKQGYGSAFISFAKQFAKERGFSALHAYSFSAYRAQDFYVKHGFALLDYPGSYNGHPYHCFQTTV